VEVHLKKFVRLASLLLALCLGLLTGCSSLPPMPWSTPEPTAAPVATPAPTEAPPRVLTLACIDPEGTALLADWEELAKAQGLNLELQAMDLQSYWMLPVSQRPDIVYFNGKAGLSNLSHLVEDGTVRRLPTEVLSAHETIQSLMQHYKPLYNDGYGFYALPRAAWDSTIGQPDGKVLYYRSDWLQSEKVDFSDITWEAFMEMMSYAASGDPDGNKIKDTKAIAVGEGLESWLLDLFGVREWVLEDGAWVPGMISNRAKDALAWASQIRKENQLRVCAGKTEALESFVRGEVAMLLWDGDAEGVSQVEKTWALIHETDGLLVENCVSVLPQPATPYGTRYLPVTEAPDFLLFDARLTDEEMEKLFCVADAAREASRSRLDVYEPESYAEGVRDQMAMYWWANAWRGPDFADGVWSDDKIRLRQGIEEKLPELLEELELVNSRFDEAWTDFVAAVHSLEAYEPACQAVNDQAKARQFFIEE